MQLNGKMFCTLVLSTWGLAGQDLTRIDVLHTIHTKHLQIATVLCKKVLLKLTNSLRLKTTNVKEDG